VSVKNILSQFNSIQRKKRINKETTRICVRKKKVRNNATILVEKKRNVLSGILSYFKNDAKQVDEKNFQLNEIHLVECLIFNTALMI
jgi:hypothetical protein